VASATDPLLPYSRISRPEPLLFITSSFTPFVFRTVYADVGRIIFRRVVDLDEESLALNFNSHFFVT
jgi:hypothetical protein